MSRFFCCTSKKVLPTSHLLVEKLPNTKVGLLEYETRLHEQIQSMTLDADKAKSDTEKYIEAGLFPLVYTTIELRGELLKLIQFLKFQLILVEKKLEAFTEGSD